MGIGRSEKEWQMSWRRAASLGFSAQRVGTWTCLYPSAGTPERSPLSHSPAPPFSALGTSKPIPV